MSEEQAPDVVLDPAQIKLREAAQDFENALERIKPKRIKKDLIEETAIDEMMSQMLQKMKESAETVTSTYFLHKHEGP